MNSIKSIEISKHFSSRSNVYDTLGNWVNNEVILSSIAACIPKSPQKLLNVVDLGAGTGAVSKYILGKYPYDISISAVDICPDMLSKIENTEIKKYVASLDSMPFENDTFDVAVSRQCLHYVEDLKQAIREIKRIVKKKGIFVLSQIVPLDSNMKAFWSEIIRFRQPLRKHYFSEFDWINLFIYEGFKLLQIERFSHRGSVKSWAKKYNISDLSVINEYKRLLLNAPKQFIEEYNVSQDMDDINYDTFWFVAKFTLDET